MTNRVDRVRRSICTPLARNRINVGLFTHLPIERERGAVTAFFLDDRQGEAACSVLELGGGGPPVETWKPVCVVSIYPHDQRPLVMGALIRSVMGKKSGALLGLATSLSAVSVLLSSAGTRQVVRSLFESFEFSAYPAFSEFEAARRHRDEHLEKVVASYQEKWVRVYCIGQQPDLCLARFILSLPDVERWVETLFRLEGQVRIPFLAAVPLQGNRLSVAMGVPAAQGKEVVRLLAARLSGVPVSPLRQAAAVYLHGPHFGDRYGIVDARARALEEARAEVLAVSCTVSSMSVLLPPSHLADAVQSLRRTFEEVRRDGEEVR